MMTEKSPFNHQKTSYCWCLAIRSERILHLKENIFHRMISLKTQNSRSFSPKIPILAFNLKFTCCVCEILLRTLSYQIQITNCHFPVCQTLCLGMNQLKQEVRRKRRRKRRSMRRRRMQNIAIFLPLCSSQLMQLCSEVHILVIAMLKLSLDSLGKKEIFRVQHMVQFLPLQGSQFATNFSQVGFICTICFIHYLNNDSLGKRKDWSVRRLRWNVSWPGQC